MFPMGSIRHSLFALHPAAQADIHALYPIYSVWYIVAAFVVLHIMPAYT